MTTSTSTTTAARATVDTPAGPFTILTEDDVVIAAGWTTDLDELLAPVAPDLRPQRIEDAAHLGPVTDAVRDYFQGVLHAVDAIAVRQHSGPFLEHAWDILRNIPPGAPVAYAELAAKAGRPDAVRAAANACARNAVPLFVPCHRVVRTDGSLGGFRWGLEVKQLLLDHEAPRP